MKEEFDEYKYLEPVIYDYVLAEQMQKQKVLSPEQRIEKEKVKQEIRRMYPEIDDEKAVWKRIAVSKQIIKHRNALYKKLVDRALQSNSQELLRYVYYCIESGREPEQVIDVKLLI